jgi:hypothetical protein
VLEPQSAVVGAQVAEAAGVADEAGVEAVDGGRRPSSTGDLAGPHPVQTQPVITFGPSKRKTRLRFDQRVRGSALALLRVRPTLTTTRAKGTATGP